jgi:haloalkane dehalogenase
MKKMSVANFHAARQFAETPFGQIAYFERGSGEPALFIHGLPLNGYHWRGVIESVADARRCVALDLMGLGYSEIPESQDLSPKAQAGMIAAFLDALSIDAVDIVANDSGGGIAQLFLAQHPDRVRSLLLTNCDVHTNLPPKALRPFIEAARAGTLAKDFVERQLNDKKAARAADGLGGLCYADPQNLTDELIECYLAPLISSKVRIEQFHGYQLSMEPNPLPAIEPKLRRYEGPVRILWGTADPFFDVEWAEWLDRTFPESQGVRRLEGAKVFFSEEVPDLVASEARALWRVPISA